MGWSSTGGRAGTHEWDSSGSGAKPCGIPAGQLSRQENRPGGLRGWHQGGRGGSRWSLSVWVTLAASPPPYSGSPLTTRGLLCLSTAFRRCKYFKLNMFTGRVLNTD